MAEGTIDRRVEELIARRDWGAILELVRDGTVGPDQTFLVGGRKAGLLSPVMADNGTELALYLIAGGAEVNAKYYGITPLMDACEWQNHRVIDALINAGAELDVKSPKGGGEADETALMTAAEKNDVWAVRRLLEAGADAKILTSRKQSAVHYALMFYANKPQPKPEATEIVGALVDAGCPLLGTELAFSTYRRDVAMTRLLLDRGCPVNVPFPHNEIDGPKKGETSLTTVVRINAVDLAGGHFGFEPTEERRVELTRMLLAAGADPNMPGAKNQTPLMIAVGQKESVLAEVLLGGGATRAG